MEQGGSLLMSIMPWILILGVMWFIMIKPQQQQMKKHNEMLKELTPGTKIITVGGICGKIKALTEDKVFLEIAEGLTIEMLRASIRQIDTDDDEDDEDEEEYIDDDDSDVYYDEEVDDKK